MDRVIIRQANGDDAAGIADVLQELVRAGKRHKPSTTEFARAHYIGHDDQIQCTVATDASGVVLGFQSMKKATVDNPYGAPVGWGVIGTHIRPSAARRGVGRALLARTLEVARQQGLPAIDATIGAGNAEGLAYYEAMGFREYRVGEGTVSKALRLED